MSLQALEQSLLTALQGDIYRNYVYSYPHKTSYRDFESPVDLATAWQAENKSSLFLYVHIPFCEMRCGYCNLFTTTQSTEQQVEKYLQALAQQMQASAEFLERYHFDQLAIGGGTPSFLSASQLEQLFTHLKQYLGVNQLPASVEVSPATLDAEKLACLKQFGVERISMGVESFNTGDLRNLGRPQSLLQVQQTLQLIRDSGVPKLNIDLIYGSANQSLATWLESVEAALAWQPEELFLYPLYVRPLTGLGRKQKEGHEQRLQFYYAAREKLLEAGYQQSSMRMFVKQSTSTGLYRCQEDGMVGLGAGARSYTQSMHYSSHYAVDKHKIGQIIDQYNQTSFKQFQHANYGIELSLEDQKRRYLLLSLLQCEGFVLSNYQQQFGANLLKDFPELVLLEKHALASVNNKMIRLNERGIAFSDVIGHWLFSHHVRQRMQNWTWQ